jgi:polar amino acid transport system permease protein
MGIAGEGKKLMINTELIQNSLPQLLYGLRLSLLIAGSSCLLGICIGFIVGFMQLSRILFLRWLSSAYVYVIRGTPMLMQITFAYYLLPQLGIVLPALETAIIAIGFNSGAYISQTVRAGILSVGIGQREAAATLGFSPLQTTFYIVLPQALRVMLPSLGNEFVTLIKDSSLASVIGVSELYREARGIINQSYDVISIFIVVAAIYFVLTTLVGFLFKVLERKMSWYVTD